MQGTFSLTQMQPWLAALRGGHIAAAPAEGVYGYVADPFSPEALAELLAAKQRSAAKGFIILVESPAQLAQFCPPLPPSCFSAVEQYWRPGQAPTTLILPALPTVPKLLTGTFNAIAVRCPQVGYVQEYMHAFGQPLVSTSLNLSGEPAATAASQIPAGIPALTLPQPLSGTPSRIFNPLENTWLR